MAKVANPNRYLTRFQSELDENLRRYSELLGALDRANALEELKKSAAEDAVFRLGALWEVYQGSWYLAAISKAPRAFVGKFQGEINAALSKEAKHLIEVIAPGALTIPPHPTLPQIEKMLDPQGFNITFSDTGAWKKAAERELSDDYLTAVRRIADNSEAASLLHLLKKLRNHLAHSSSGSQEELSKAARRRQHGQKIGLTGQVNQPLWREENGITDVGKYLRTSVKGTNERRLNVLFARVRSVSELLRV